MGSLQGGEAQEHGRGHTQRRNLAAATVPGTPSPAHVCVVGRGPGTVALAGMWAMHAAAGLLPGQGPALVTLAHAIPPLSAGCPEPVGEDVCSHPWRVPGGAAEAHDRLGTYRLQTLGLQGAATAQSLR